MAQLRVALREAKALLDVVAGELAVGGEVVGLEFRDLAVDGPADLDRGLVELLLHAPRARVSRASLDREHLGPGHGFKRLPRFLTDFLSARVARDVIPDLAQQFRNLGLD